ncbi:hypothetical protein V3589_06655 [Sinorhizobium fredii]
MTDRTPRQLTNTWIILVLMVLAGLLLSLKVQNSAAHWFSRSAS